VTSLRHALVLAIVLAGSASLGADGRDHAPAIGAEVGNAHPLQDGEEYELPLSALLQQGEALLAAVWTPQEGGGRPLTKGVGEPLSDPGSPLTFPRSFNRISAPDANSCFGCHAQPFGQVGGSGDIVANVFVLGQRFDFATFDTLDGVVTRGTVAENGDFATLDDIANSRATIGMFGSGFIEMLARQMTAELQVLRDGLAAGDAVQLVAKGVSFGTLARLADGSWDTGGVEGLPAPSLQTGGPATPPNLIIRPFHQAGAVVSLRQFTNNAFNHHHGIQAVERFGAGTDPDGDGFADELSRADVTAATLFQATLPVPGRVIPRDRHVREAIASGEQLFSDIGCATCHRPTLPLTDGGWIFSEPNPYNPPGNLQPGDAPPMTVDLTDPRLPGPRLHVRDGTVWVPAFTDLKLHDITSGPDDPNREPLDMNAPAGSPEFFAGNAKFLTKKLWGAANQPPFFHHGKFTTLREAILAHAGEAQAATDRYEALSSGDQDALVEFLKSLQILGPRTRHRVVDERGLPRPH
jgi:hypothetical protein